ncbi:hypothetical protein C173_11445 [Paenibacillus sp. FSL R7-277]|nr:hypothetical protein C173_11445 [Paenibacillus sp. FSL R7-277]
MEAGSGELELYGKSPLLHLQGGPGQYRIAARGKGAFCVMKQGKGGGRGGARPNVCEKPNTFGVCGGARANVCEQPNTFGVCGGARANMCEKPNTYGGRGGVEDGWRRLEVRAQRCGGKQLPFIHLLVNKRLLLRQWLDKQHLILHISTKVTRSN